MTTLPVTHIMLLLLLHFLIKKQHCAMSMDPLYRNLKQGAMRIIRVNMQIKFECLSLPPLVKQKKKKKKRTTTMRKL
ncbi:hypothetical protein BDF20DRAFT_883415, partial [Mycotypha africana]|uniref:uncharacterized protein n=1 Tax=Mycotypha africana TaxID=64632 RepID=UPI002300205B